MNDFRQSNFLSRIPPVTRNLLIINVLVWVVVAFCGLLPGAAEGYVERVQKLLGLHYWGSPQFNPVQLVTYMFVHSSSSPLHLFFNMFALWMFGRLMEQTWGPRKYFIFYFVCGAGAAVVQELVWQMTWMGDFVNRLAQINGQSPQYMYEVVRQGMAADNPDVLEGIKVYQSGMLTIGASGAIFGVLLGFAFTFPNMPLYLFPIPVPVKAKYMVVGYGVIEFFLGIASSDSSIAHFAHLGGMLFGLLLLLYWKKKGTLTGDYYR